MFFGYRGLAFLSAACGFVLLSSWPFSVLLLAVRLVCTAHGLAFCFPPCCASGLCCSWAVLSLPQLARLVVHAVLSAACGLRCFLALAFFLPAFDVLCCAAPWLASSWPPSSCARLWHLLLPRGRQFAPPLLSHLPTTAPLSTQPLQRICWCLSILPGAPLPARGLPPRWCLISSSSSMRSLSWPASLLRLHLRSATAPPSAAHLLSQSSAGAALPLGGSQHYPGLTLRW